MKLKDKIKSYSFWISIVSALVLILKVIGAKFGFTVDETFISNLTTSLCSVLVLLGIIVSPTGKVENIPNFLESKTLENVSKEPKTSQTTEGNTQQESLSETSDNKEFENSVYSESKISEQNAESILNKSENNTYKHEPDETIYVETMSYEPECVKTSQDIQTDDTEVVFSKMIEDFANQFPDKTESILTVLEKEIAKLKKY